MAELIYKSKNDEPMRAAKIRAVRTFKYFWREMSWESRRIVPGLDLSAIKVPIKTDSKENDVPEYEHMWYNEVEFDGVTLSGTLLNQPKWVGNIQPGNRMDFKLNDITDWMYAINKRVFGAFTVNVMRATMGKDELRQHDHAWDLDFGDPNEILVAPVGKKDKPGVFGLFKGKTGHSEDDDIPEHPMSLNMAEKCEQGLLENRRDFIQKNSAGSSMLHFDALAGNLTQVNILLKYGADVEMKDKNGNTPLQLAKVLNWNKIIDVLK